MEVFLEAHLCVLDTDVRITFRERGSHRSVISLSIENTNPTLVLGFELLQSSPSCHRLLIGVSKNVQEGSDMHISGYN